MLIALLVPVRLLLDRKFNTLHLAFLDSEEEVEEERGHLLGP